MFTIIYTDEPTNVIWTVDNTRTLIHLFDTDLLSQNYDIRYINDIPILSSGAIFTNNIFPISIDFESIKLYKDFKIWFGNYSVYCGLFFHMHNFFDPNMTLIPIDIKNNKYLTIQQL